MALLFVGLELAVLSWMVVEEEVYVGPVLDGRMVVPKGRGHRTPRRERKSSQPTVLPLRPISKEDKGTGTGPQ
jgi:hypothetical protein